VAVVRQRRDRDVGDVVGVDERLGHVARGQRHLAAPDPVDDVVLAEVLHVERTIVRSAPDARTASSASSASGSPRPARSTSLLAPLRTASSANEPTVSGAPGTARSG
jgi:hypothetical protein